MSERDPTSDEAAHKVVDVLLPWYVNGTLARGEAASVERHLAGCARCRDEVEWLQSLHSACVTASESSAAASGLRRRLDESRPPRSASLHGGRWAVALALAAFAVIGTALFATADGPVYRTLGGREAQPASGSIVVVFDPSVRESDLRRIVRAAGARIVDGPTATNAYVLAVPAQARDRALTALRSERDVTLAERFDAGAAR